MEQIQLLTRGDDFGSFRTANIAIKDCVDQGILKNVSIMLIADYWKDAIQMFKGRDDVCLGVHLSINAEWLDIRWKPLLPPEQISSLLADDGCLRRNIQDQIQARPDEIMAECQAQVDLARNKGLNIEYIDTHCCFDWFQDGKLGEMLADFAQKEGLVYHLSFQEFAPLPKFEKDDIISYVKALENLELGKTYRVVAHPCYPVEELKNVGQSPDDLGLIGKDRDFQRQMFMHPDVVKTVQAGNIELIKYTEI